MPDDSSENVIEAQINKWLEENKEIKGMLELSSDAVETLSKINSWVGTAIGVLKMMGLFGEEKSPFESLFEAIDGRLKQIVELINDIDLRDHMKDISEKLGISVTSAKEAIKFINNGRPSGEDMDQQYHDTHVALDQLMDYEGPFWVHSFNKNLVDSEILPTEGDMVWDYRFALPAALRALAAWLVIVEAKDPDYKRTGSYSDEIMGYADDLLGIHEKFTQSIRARKLVSLSRREQDAWSGDPALFPHVPTGGPSTFNAITAGFWNKVTGFYEIPFSLIDTSYLSIFLVRCGMVEVLSGTSTITEWNVLGRSPTRREEVWELRDKIDTKEKYFDLFQAETRKRWLPLYNDLGLNALADTVVSLMILAKPDVISGSLRELAQLFNLSSSISLRALLVKAGANNLTLRQLQRSALKENRFKYVAERPDQLLTLEELTYSPS
jgi:hypothetical protein